MPTHSSDAANECICAAGREVPHRRCPVHGESAASGFEKLRSWALDEAHVVQSVRPHEPQYRNPAEPRADVRELLSRYDAICLYRLRTEGVLDAAS